jgi:hypothetical protein
MNGGETGTGEVLAPPVQHKTGNGLDHHVLSADPYHMNDPLSPVIFDPEKAVEQRKEKGKRCGFDHILGCVEGFVVQRK